MSTLICRTRACGNKDKPIELDLTTLDVETGDTVFVDFVVCGICQQPITDITPPFTPGAPG